MKVSEAMERRISVRAFLDEPVEDATLMRILGKAARAPSGGNLQPWRVVIVNGEAMTRFKSIMEDRLAGCPHPEGEAAEYRVYPPDLKEPYRTSRFTVGEQMYALLGIERGDRPARLNWFANNFRFFGAPAAIFVFVDRIMGAPQWADLGMFLQGFMLLAQEEGLDTCPQECWAAYPKTVSEFCNAPPELMLFCGVAIGKRDPGHPVNRLRSEREPLENWVSMA